MQHRTFCARLRRRCTLKGNPIDLLSTEGPVCHRMHTSTISFLPRSGHNGLFDVGFVGRVGETQMFFDAALPGGLEFS
jgi:hypothetical protein